MPAALTVFAKYVRPEVSGCPELIILDAIKRAGMEFCKRTKIIRETLTLTTVVDQASYALDTEEGTVADEVLAVKREGADNLDPSSYYEFSANHMDRDTGPPNYYYLDVGGELVLGNIPDAVEDLVVTVRVRPTDEATTLPAELADRYMLEIAAGAKAILMIQRNKPWSDPDGAALNGALFEQNIDNVNLRDAKGAARKPLRTKLQTF
jgi:hypothetical protein